MADRIATDAAVAQFRAWVAAGRQMRQERMAFETEGLAALLARLAAAERVVEAARELAILAEEAIQYKSEYLREKHGDAAVIEAAEAALADYDAARKEA